MAIRSSSDESQLMVLSSRLRFPLKPSAWLEAQAELPTTTNRPWPEGLPVLYVPATASVKGPCLSLEGSMRISAELRLLVAKLSADVENSLLIVVLSVFLVSSERESGKAVEILVRSLTMGCESYCMITGASGPPPNNCDAALSSSSKFLSNVTPQLSNMSERA